MTQRCFMLCTTYKNVWSIICPMEVRCLTPLSKIFHLLLLLRKLEYPEKSTDLSQVTDKLDQCFIEYTPPWMGFKLTTWVVISNDCTGSCKFNYHTTTTAQVQLRWKVIVLLILMEFMIITVYKLSFHINQWKELVCWKYVSCWGSLNGICISCEVPSIADTTLGISEQYLFFCHQTEMVGHWIHITFS